MGIRHIRGALMKACLLIGSVCLGLVAIEGGARVYLAVAKPQLGDYYAFMKSSPPPYRDAGFYSTAYVDEFIDDGGYHTPPGTRLVIPNDRQGEYINIREGRRHTAYQPAVAEKTVYVLGGSTILSREVPDDQTIPSHLQRLLRDHPDESYRVENLGVISVNTRQQLERLKTLELRRGDIVLFYDGVNEIYHSLYFNKPDGWTVEDHVRDRAALPWHRRWIFDLYDGLYHKSSFVTHFLNPYDSESVPPHLRDRAALDRLLVELEENYLETITEANRFCEERGVEFHHFLQPNLFTVDDRSEYEESLLAQPPFHRQRCRDRLRPRLSGASEGRTTAGVERHLLHGSVDGAERTRRGRGVLPRLLPCQPPGQRRRGEVDRLGGLCAGDDRETVASESARPDNFRGLSQDSGPP